MSQEVLIALVLAGVLALAALLVAALAWRRPDQARRLVLALFRRPQRPARAPGKSHYYKPYWS
jgi:hypothetical protein